MRYGKFLTMKKGEDMLFVGKQMATGDDNIKLGSSHKENYSMLVFSYVVFRFYIII